jgi:hypothetical protein
MGGVRRGSLEVRVAGDTLLGTAKSRRPSRLERGISSCAMTGGKVSQLPRTEDGEGRGKREGGDGGESKVTTNWFTKSMVGAAWAAAQRGNLGWDGARIGELSLNGRQGMSQF